MAVLVDPPQRDSADERPPGETPALPGTTTTATTSTAPVTGAEKPRLAEPPIAGGRVEEFMGRIIKVLAHSPLARPLPAVIAERARAAGGSRSSGCAPPRPRPSAATLPVMLPLTEWRGTSARRSWRDLLATSSCTCRSGCAAWAWR